MKPVITFHIARVSDYGYHRLQVYIQTSLRTSLADRLQHLFDNPDEVCGRSSLPALLSATKDLCRRGHKEIFEATFNDDALVIDWLEYKGSAASSKDYCAPQFKIETKSVQALRKTHNWLSRIARSVAKSRDSHFDPNCFSHHLNDAHRVLATLRRLPSFIETEPSEVEGFHFVVDKINPAVDQEQAAQ